MFGAKINDDIKFFAIAAYLATVDIHIFKASATNLKDILFINVKILKASLIDVEELQTLLVC